MHDCPECGKRMATAGGLEIHVQMAHAAPAAPAAAPVAPAAPTADEIATAPAPPVARVRQAQAPSAQLPVFLRGFDPTVPLTALLAVALLVAGVGSAVRRSSHGATAPAASLHTLATTAPASKPLAVNATDDQKLAQSLVLDQNDFPDGWTLTPHTRDAAQEQDSRALAACVGRPDPATTETADVDGADGSGGSGLQAGSNVSTTHTEQQALDDLAAVASTKATECVKKSAADSLGRRGIQVVDVGVGRYSVATANIPSVAMHLEVAGVQGGSRGLLYVDEVFMQRGRIEAQAFFVSLSGHFPIDVEQTLVTRLAHKVAGV